MIHVISVKVGRWCKYLHGMITPHADAFALPHRAPRRDSAIDPFEGPARVIFCSEGLGCPWRRSVRTKLIKQFRFQTTQISHFRYRCSQCKRRNRVRTSIRFPLGLREAPPSDGTSEHPHDTSITLGYTHPATHRLDFHQGGRLSCFLHLSSF